MTPRQKVIAIFIAIPIIWFSLASFVMSHFITNDSEVDAAISIALIIIMAIITFWLFSKIKTEEEHKEYSYIHTQLLGFSLLGSGLFLLFYIFSYDKQTMFERIVELIIAILLILISTGVFIYNKRKNRDN